MIFYDVNDWFVINFCMITAEKARDAVLKPEYYADTVIFMLESCFTWIPTEQALATAFRQRDLFEVLAERPT